MEYPLPEKKEEIFNSLTFLYWYFNDLLWLMSDDNKYSISEKRQMIEIIREYKRIFHLNFYKNKQIWDVLYRKFYKDFDELLYINN